jgi:hypothetical protein
MILAGNPKMNAHEFIDTDGGKRSKRKALRIDAQSGPSTRVDRKDTCW